MRISRTFDPRSSSDAVPLKAGGILIGVSITTLKQGAIICRGGGFILPFSLLNTFLSPVLPLCVKAQAVSE